MKKSRLDRFAMPRTSVRYALQALASAQRRWRQMTGHIPAAPPGEEVSHFTGPAADRVPGARPDSPVEEVSRNPPPGESES